MVHIEEHLPTKLYNSDINVALKPPQPRTIYDDICETEQIVTTLYAKPGSGEPFLTLYKLKKGVYEKASYLGIKSFILFSDIGYTAWNVALEMDKNSSIELLQTSILEEDKSWQVMIRNPYLTAMINSVRFRPIGKYISSFYISIDMSGKSGPIIAFVRGMMDLLGRNPWENSSGELDWEKFIKKTSISKKEVIEQWALLSGLSELSPDYSNETVELLCRNCQKGMEKEWAVCPFCGELLKDFY